MAETIGLVQRLNIFESGIACVWVGPTPTITEVLFVVRGSSDPAHVGAFKNSIVDAITTAYLDRQEVVAVHPDDSGEITSLRLEPS